MSRLFRILATFLLLLPQTSTWSQDVRSEIEKIITHDTDISYDQVPGFLVGIVDGDSLFIEGFGSWSKTGREAPSAHDIYEIGGLTKVFSALLCQILHDQGVIKLGESINEYLPDSLENPSMQEVTWNHLLTHTSGLPYLPPNLAETEVDPDNRYAYYNDKYLASYFLSIRREPLTGRYLYSHTNYALIGWILSLHLHQPFSQILQSQLFDELNLDETFLAGKPESDERLSPGFNHAGKKVSPWQFASFAASEGMRSSAHDLCSFIQDMMSGNKQINISFDRTLIPMIKIPGSKRSYTGIGWHMMRGKKKEPIYLHSGKTSGHAASIHFVSRTRTAVILITNTPARMDGLALLVLRMMNNHWKRIK